MIERRLSPRYPLDWPLDVRAPTELAFDAQLTDISATGIGFLTSHTAVQGLAQGGGLLTPGDRVSVEWRVRTGDVLAESLEMECRVRHVRRIARDRFHVGALFIDPDAEQGPLIERLLARADNM